MFLRLERPKGRVSLVDFVVAAVAADSGERAEERGGERVEGERPGNDRTVISRSPPTSCSTGAAGRDYDYGPPPDINL